MTERGWGVAGAGIAAVTLWILLGEVELLAAGSVLLAAVGIAWLIARTTRPDVEVVRQLMPALVHEGDTAEVRARITNFGQRTLYNVTVADVVGTMGSAEFGAGTIRRNETVLGTYRIVCRPRGVYPVGPAEIEIADPARLVTRSVTAQGSDRLVVYPAVEELLGFPLARGMDPSTQASKPEFSNRGGEDFYTLREYVEGDDLRFIHWPSSAKRDTLLIRQLETPWQQRALILLDLRRGVYQNAACFEHAVRGAASVVVHFAKGGYDALVWAGGTDPIPSHHTAAVMEQLALAKTDTRLDLRSVASRVRQRGGGGALLLVTGTPDGEIGDVSRLLAQDYGTALVLCATETASAASVGMHRAGVSTIERAPGQGWAEGWAMATRMTWSDSRAR